MLHRLAILFGTLALLGACVERGEGPVLSSGDRYTAGTDIVADYRLGAGDRVRVTVFNEPTLSGDFWVNPDGTVSLPLIGNIPASGRHITEVSADARTRYADGYLRDPKVAVDVIVFRPFYILGEVEQPGQYPYAIGMNAMNAIATAKGFTPRASRDVIRIRRQGGAAEESFRLTPELQIYPGDTIRIGERFF